MIGGAKMIRAPPQTAAEGKRKTVYGSKSGKNLVMTHKPVDIDTSRGYINPHLEGASANSPTLETVDLSMVSPANA